MPFSMCMALFALKNFFVRNRPGTQVSQVPRTREPGPGGEKGPATTIAGLFHGFGAQPARRPQKTKLVEHL